MTSHTCAYALLMLLIGLQNSWGANPIKSADSLITLRKYNAAFALLNDLPASNDDRAIVIKKIDIALQYFVQSINHTLFAFKDLDPGEDLVDIRGKQGNYSIYMFPIDSILTRLISKYPNDGRLYQAFGDYYYDVSMRYEGRWSISDDSLASLVFINYAKAHSLHADSYRSLHRLGVGYLMRSDYKSAEPCFTQAIALKPEEADPYYNLAYLWMQRKDYRRAIDLGMKAFERYEDLGLRSDAGRLIASCYTDLHDFPKALVFLARVDAFDPHNRYVYRMRMSTYLQMGAMDSAFDAARRLFQLHPTFPSTTQSIIEDYAEAGHAGVTANVLERLLPLYAANDSAAGNLYFFLGGTYAQESSTAKALTAYEAAEVRFRRCFAPDDEVFEAIASQKKALTKK